MIPATVYETPKVLRRRLWLVIAVALIAVACASPAATTAPATASPTAAPNSAPPQVTASPSLAPAADLLLVAIGDSIPFNSPDDCFGCTGFVDRYADAIAEATGETIEVRNLSQHNTQTLPGLLAVLENFRDDLSVADIVVVGIAHNTTVFSSDAPCGAPLVNDAPVWSEIDEDCVAASADLHRPEYESLYSQIVAMRDGMPTLFRTINRYNDWLGWPPTEGVPEAAEKSKLVVDVWDDMLCTAAEDNDFGCADIYHAFNGPEGSDPAGDLLAADFIHPSDKGNEAIANVLIEMGFDPLD